MADQVDARVRATCTRCGTVEVPVAQARLTAGVDRDGGSTLAFDCPRCGAECSTSVDSRTARLLLGADVALHAPSTSFDATSPGESRI